ncbi:MAG: hypothetical protein K1Y36_00010 [Blastocatellia bacterium]|nr:hypothetical protein [Blastocatellia bacterium]
MGRIVTAVRIENTTDPERTIRCNALVSTGTAHLVLPAAWRDQIGELNIVTSVDLEMPDGSTVRGDVYGPVRVTVDGFRPVYNEVVFLDMHPENGIYEPLVGYLILEQCQAAVDMVGHRLLPVNRMDLK